MGEQKIPKPNLIPFLIADVLMLAVAGFIVYFSKWPLEPWQVAICAFAVLAGGVFLVTPFYLEHKATLKIAESESLVSTVSKIQKLEEVAKQITSATNYWQAAQADAANTVETARQIHERISREAREFADFMQKANDVEKTALRIEVEKLNRIMDENLQVVVNLLDNVYALYRAALQSGDKRLIEQIALFQMTCRQIAQRIGLVAFDGKSGEKFSAERHRNVDQKAQILPDAVIAGAIAPGYTYQTKMLRQALVSVGSPQDMKQEPNTGSPS
ncbi:MAG: nucleotide exchange factor GrpE [Verrucomicrobiae bacterium]|nr:nucleotide exchange factor GrpE [Verrucomicrobiae bacterium]